MAYKLIEHFNTSSSSPSTPSIIQLMTPGVVDLLGGNGERNGSSLVTYQDNDVFNPDDSPAYVTMRRLQTVLIPVICVLGIAGNVLAAGTFLSASLNKSSCCFHLASKSLNDIGFLVSLFVVWLFRLRVPLFTTPGVCQITVFLTYVCGCMSVWFVVSITAENFIRFTQPRLVQRYCNVPVAKRLVLGIIVTSACCYNFSLWTTDVVEDLDGSRHCNSLEHFKSIVMATTIIDTALTLILPSIIMFFLIASIVFKSLESFERKKRLRASSSGPQRLGHRRKMTPEGKMTTFLFVISLIFLALNLPTHAIRLKMLIQVYIQHQSPSFSDIILQRVFEILLYFNFSTNCLIYLVCGERFRKVFTSMYLRRCRKPRGGGGAGGESALSERSDASPIMLKQRGNDVENDESVCLTCVNADVMEPAALPGDINSQNFFISSSNH